MSFDALFVPTSEHLCVGCGKLEQQIGQQDNHNTTEESQSCGTCLDYTISDSVPFCLRLSNRIRSPVDLRSGCNGRCSIVSAIEQWVRTGNCYRRTVNVRRKILFAKEIGLFILFF